MLFTFTKSDDKLTSENSFNQLSSDSIELILSYVQTFTTVLTIFDSFGIYPCDKQQHCKNDHSSQSVRSTTDVCK